MRQNCSESSRGARPRSPEITKMLAPAMVDSLVSCAVSFLAGTTLCVCGRPYLQCGSSLISCLLCAFDLASSYLTRRAPCVLAPCRTLGGETHWARCWTRPRGARAADFCADADLSIQTRQDLVKMLLWYAPVISP